MEILIVAGGMLGTLLLLIIIGIKKGFFERDNTIYHCNYCNATSDVHIYFKSGLNICGSCKKEAFDSILQNKVNMGRRGTIPQPED
ncbi:MAG TPA: hypothetical protein ENI23_04180 [bacterium]|nr:hypothetical protein [bacterium]